jgi:hypothetical protein
MPTHRQESANPGKCRLLPQPKMFSQDVVRTSKLLFIIYNLDSTGFLAASDPMPPHPEGSCPILQGLNNLMPHHAGEEGDWRFTEKIQVTGNPHAMKIWSQPNPVFLCMAGRRSRAGKARDLCKTPLTAWVIISPLGKSRHGGKAGSFGPKGTANCRVAVAGL